jgi:hypothetical protein
MSIIFWVYIPLAAILVYQFIKTVLVLSDTKRFNKNYFGGK